MRQIKINGIYKHFKNKTYQVIAIAHDCETEEEIVIYKALYNDNKIWARKKQDFLSQVDKNKYPNINQKYRFEEL